MSYPAKKIDGTFSPAALATAHGIQIHHAAMSQVDEQLSIAQAHNSDLWEFIEENDLLDECYEFLAKRAGITVQEYKSL